MSFDRVAPFYCFLETITFGQALQRARICFSRKISPPVRALVVGEGNGRFLCDLVGVHPRIEIDCVDASKQMLELSRARVQRNHPESLGRIRFFHADIRLWSPPQLYDLIVTHFFLDCFDRFDLELIVAKLAECATEDAKWLVSDFAPPEKLLARRYAAIELKVMYMFFRLTTDVGAQTLVDPRPSLESRGFVRRSLRLFRGGTLYASMYTRLESGR